MKHHLAGTKKSVIPCCSVPEEVKEIFMKLLKRKKKRKKINKFDCAEVTREVAKEKNNLQQMTINASYKNREYVIQEVFNRIYRNASPFHLVRSPLFIQTLKAVGEYGKG